MTYCIYIYYEQWIYIFSIELVCVCTLAVIL